MEYVNTEEAARILGRHKESIRRLAKKGVLQCYTQNGVKYYYYLKSEVEALVFVRPKGVWSVKQAAKFLGVKPKTVHWRTVEGVLVPVIYDRHFPYYSIKDVKAYGNGRKHRKNKK